MANSIMFGGTPTYMGMSRYGQGQLGSGTYGMDMGMPSENPLQFSTPGSNLYGNTESAYWSSIGIDPASMAGPNFASPSNTDILKQLGGFSVPGAGGMTDWMRDIGFLGTRDQQGWGGLAMGAAQGLGGLYMGMKQYGLAKDALQSSKDQFERNYAAQRTTTNSALEDRQRARLASNPGAYESMDSYMNRNGVK